MSGDAAHNLEPDNAAPDTESAGQTRPRSPAAHLQPYWYPPGRSGNPKGGFNAYGLAYRAREATKNGEELIQFFVNVMRGEPMRRPKGLPQYPRPELRVAAAEWLADRGWGRAKEIIDLAPEPSRERVAALARLSEADRATLREILTRAFEEPTPESPELPSSTES
jgi:hypothetical protein